MCVPRKIWPTLAFFFATVSVAAAPDGRCDPSKMVVLTDRTSAVARANAHQVRL